MAVVAAVLVYLVVVAIRLRIDYFDSYQNLLNARILIERGGGTFSILRGPLYPVLLVPGTLVARLPHSPTLALVLSHLLAVLLLGLLLGSTLLLFRLQLPPLTAWGAVVLLSWNVLIIANGPLAKEDIAGTLFLTAAFGCYLIGRPRPSPWWLIAAGLLVGAAGSTRYTLLPVPFVVIAGYEAFRFVVDGIHQAELRRLALMLVTLFLVPLAVIVVIPTLVYADVHRASLAGAPAQFVRDLLTLRDITNAGQEDALRNYRFLVEAVTWPVLVAALAGVIAAIRRRQGIAVFYGLWFITVFGLQTYVVGHKEARYLIAAFPPIYWFAATGLAAVIQLVSSVGRRRRLAPVAGITLSALLLAVPAAAAVSALSRFQDPVYSGNYEAMVSRYALRLAGNGGLTWVGPYYPIHPRDYVFDRQDPFTFIYHFYWHVVSFWTDRQVGASTTFDGLRDGDVVILNRAPAGYDTGSMPAQLPPLVVERLKIEAFTAAGPDVWASAQGGQLQATAQGSGWRVDGAGLTDGNYDLFLSVPGQGTPSLTPVTIQNGHFEVSVLGPSLIAKVALVSYDASRSFPPE
jgi:hypothetical protein